MAVHNFTVATNDTGDLEAKLSDRRTHAIHGSIVLARVSRVFDQPFDWPQLDVLGRRMREHTPPSEKLILRDLSEGALCARLSN
jgi:hypothetical protein